MRTSFLKKKWFWVGGFMVAIFGLEMALRLVLGLGSPPLLKADERVGYLFQANQELVRFTNRVHINKYHQRSSDLSASPTSRVLFLGDSVTWGGVLTDQSQTYPEYFERRMESYCSVPVEALNASAGSWGVGNLQAYAERFGFFQSEFVVIQIGTHDLTQAKSDGSVVGKHPSYPRTPPTLAIGELVNRYLWPRYLQPWLRDYWPQSGADAKGATAAEQSSKLRKFRKNMGALQSLVESARTAGRSVLILYTPNRGEVAAGTKGSLQEDSPFYRKFLEWVEDHHVRILNLHKKWQSRSGVSGYYRDHLHLNERGNKVVAKALTKFILSHATTVCKEAGNIRRPSK